MTNTTFTYQPFGADRSYSQGSTRAPYPKQIEKYVQVCRERNMIPQATTSFTADTISQEIQRLLSLPRMASDRQKQLIRDIHARIQSLGGNLKPLNEDRVKSATGDEAQAWIDVLMERERELNIVAPPTPAQLQTITQWFLCPDIPWETYNIEKKVYLEQLTAWNSDVNLVAELDVRPWRWMTGDEFARQLTLKLTRTQASELISQYRGLFYEWRQTRITQAQYNLIRTHEKRLANTFKPRIIESIVDINGELIDNVPTKSSREEYAPQGYDFLSDEQLYQMSQDDASEWIQRLEMEQRSDTYRSLYIYGEQSDNSETFEEIRQAQDMNAWKTKEFTAFNDFLYALQARAGLAVDEYQDEAVRVFFEYDSPQGGVASGSDEAMKKFRRSVARFMFNAIMDDSITFQLLTRMAERSEIATGIIKSLTRTKKYASRILQKQMM